MGSTKPFFTNTASSTIRYVGGVGGCGYYVCGKAMVVETFC